MPTKFVFLLLPNMHILDLAGADQAIHEAIDYGANFNISYCGIDENIQTTSGMSIGKVKHFSTIKFNKGDFLIIPGCDFKYLTSKAFRNKKDLFKWIHVNYDKGINVCSICMGAFVLAETGLLNQVACTTHFKKTAALQEMYPQAKVVENILFTDNDGIYTSAGIASGIDLTLHIIEKLQGSYFANKVARELVVYNRRVGSAAQESEFLKFRNHIHAGIHQTQDFIIEHIDTRMNLLYLAEIANMSERNFTRIFKRETGVTVNDFITNIRKEKIKELLNNPDMSKIEIANKVGLQSEKQLYRIIKNTTI